MSTECVICGLIDTGSANWVAREELAVAFEPLVEDTLAPGHTVVAPRKHVEGLFGPTESELASVLALVQRVAAAMRSRIGSTGTFVIQASGPDSGGTVPHVHFHVIPCWADDDASFWPLDRSAHALTVEPYAEIRSAFQ